MRCRIRNTGRRECTLSTAAATHHSPHALGATYGFGVGHHLAEHGRPQDISCIRIVAKHRVLLNHHIKELIVVEHLVHLLEDVGVFEHPVEAGFIHARGTSHSSVGAKHVSGGQVREASIAGAGKASERVVGGSGSHVGGHLRLTYGLLGRGGRGSGRRIAGGALDQVNCVAGLDLVCAERLLVLHDTARVDESLSLDGDILEVGGGQLGLEVEDGGGLVHGDSVIAVTRGLDLEGDLGFRSLGSLGHGCAGIWGLDLW